MTFSQCCRSGNFDRRLYRGLCSAISRSSRISASSDVPHSIPRTPVAMPTISPIRLRVSEAVKYDRTRVRRSFDLPTYSTSPRSSVNRYTPGACGNVSARWRLARTAGATRDENVCRSSSVCTPSEPTRSNSPCSTSTVARASDNARWFGVVVVRKSLASVPSLQFGASSGVITRRASSAVSTTAKSGQSYPCTRLSCFRKPMSNGALCATITQPWANSRNAGSTDSIRGDEATIELVMPVSTAMNGGIGSDGFTSVWNSPITSPARTFTAPISVIPDSPGAPPVVSRSTTQNVTSRSGVPRSSKLGWTPRIGISGSGAGARTGLVMATTLRAATDNSAGDTRGESTRLSVCVHRRSPRFRASCPPAVVCVTGRAQASHSGRTADR